MNRIRVLFGLVVVLGSTLFAHCHASRPDQVHYHKLGMLSSYKGNIFIEDSLIRVFDAMDRKRIEPVPPSGWKGEAYSVSDMKWIDSSFKEIRYYYSNDTLHGDVDFQEYDAARTRKLKLQQEYLKSPEIRSRYVGETLKAYVSGDLNRDGKLDLVLVYSDETRTKKPFIDYYMFIYEQVENGEYHQKFVYSYQDVSVGKVEIRDVTGDGKNEVLLWDVSWGGSGWGIGVTVFSRVL